METTAENKDYGIATMTANNRGEYQVRLSNAETDHTALRNTALDQMANQLQKEIDGIFSNLQ